MSRNTGGNYSLPIGGNPVLTGTTVSSTWANNTLNDIALELTNSLDRQGRGGMVAQLKAVDGTKAAPEYSFTSEASSGLYRAGAGDVRLSVLATDAVKATNTAVTLSLPATAAGTLTSTGAFTASSTSHLVGAVTADAAVTLNGALDAKAGVTLEKGVTVTQSTADTAGITTTGNGTGAGISATGAAGVVGVGTTYQGGTFTGAAGWAGVNAKNGTAATGAARQDALSCENGDIDLHNVANPNSNVAISNRVTPKNVVKAWARISTDAADNVTVNDGFNITSVAISTTTMTVTLASAFTDASKVAAVATQNNGGSASGIAVLSAYPNGTTTVRITGVNLAAGPSMADINFATAAVNIGLVVLGPQ